MIHIRQTDLTDLFNKNFTVQDLAALVNFGIEGLDNIYFFDKEDIFDFKDYMIELVESSDIIENVQEKIINEVNKTILYLFGYNE